jgi:hypothetical protein
MIRNVLLLVFVACFAVTSTAQILTHPMNFEVNAPANVAATYDYGYQVDWGPTSINTTCGDMAWGFTANGDSLACDPIITDLTGKIAAISRGACNFSLKVYHAQQAGAVGAVIINANSNPATQIVNMLGGDSMTAVTIPAVFLNFGDGGPIGTEISAGTTVNACFKVPLVSDPASIVHFSTPTSHPNSLDSFYLTVYNNGMNAETNVTVNVDVEDPGGMVQSYSRNWGTLGASSQEEIAVGGGYIPSAVGNYNVSFSVTSDAGTYAGESESQQFEMTNYTFANDDHNNIVGAITPADFTTDLRYDIGNFYFSSAAGVATHASFALSNANAMHGENFNIFLYDVDNDLDGVLDGGDYTDYTLVGFNTLTIDSTIHMNDDTILVAITPNNGVSNDLVADGSYLVVVEYDALLSPNGNIDPPGFIHSSPTGSVTFGTAVYTSQLFTGGWSGGWQAVLRMHLDGYVTINTDEVKILDEASFSIYPNPVVNDFVTLDLTLEEMSEEVNVKILDLNGRELQNYNYSNVRTNKYTYGVENLPAGNYFLRVQTDEGFRSEHFVIMK